MSRWLKLLIGLALTLLVGWLGYGPFGAGKAYVDLLQQRADFILQDPRAQVPGVQARISRNPLSRTVFMCGPADSFQRQGTLNWERASDYPGLEGRMLMIGGISSVVWDPPAASPSQTAPPCRPGGPNAAGGLPLLVELLGLAALAWLIGLGIGWVIRRRPRRTGYLS